MLVTASVDELIRGFSCPQVGLDEAFLEYVAVAFARELTQRYVATHDDAISSAAGLGDVVSGSVADMTFREAWNPIFGEMYESLAGRGDLSHAEIACRLGLWLHECGRPGSWRIDAPLVGGRRFDRWILPAARSMSVESDGDTAVVSLDDDGVCARFSFVRRDDGWLSEDAEALPRVAMSKHRLTFLTRNALESPEFGYLRDDLLERSSWEALPSRYAEAFGFIREHAPIYLDWIDRLLRYVIPLRGGDGQIVSGSSQNAPAIAHMSNGSCIAALAEMLVHETTHLYFHLLTRVRPVHDGSDPKEYYSPIKRRGRPIHFILVAYHAFANVLLFYRLCLESGYADPDGYVARNERELVPQLRQLDDALNTTKALTPIGRAMWEPLTSLIG